MGSSTIVKHSKNSVTDGKQNGGVVTTRLTRSAVQKDILNSTVEVEQGSSNGKFASLVSTRLTHSAEKKMRCVANIKQELENNKLTQDAEELVTPENIEGKKKKIPSSVDTETNLTLDSRKRTRASMSNGLCSPGAPSLRFLYPPCLCDPVSSLLPLFLFFSISSSTLKIKVRLRRNR